MIRYFFKQTFRSIRKYKVNTLISLIGLSVGLTSFILISSYLKHEFSFNKYNENYENIYISRIRFNGVGEGNSMPYPVVEALTSSYPEVKYGVRFSFLYAQLENKENDRSFFERNGKYVDNEFFKVFTVNFLSGDHDNPLTEPYTIVLTKSTAHKYFGADNPVGKTLLFDGSYYLTVTAVIDDLPKNSDFNFDFFVSMKTKLAMNPNKDFLNEWDNHHFRIVVLLEENCDYKMLNGKIASIFDHVESEIPVKRELVLSPLSKYHLKQDSDDNSLKNLIILSTIALLILIIACINFINLSISNAANQVKETGIKRIMGSKKSNLILQHIGESVFLAFISFDLAYLLSERLLPNFSAIVGTQIPSGIILNFSFISTMLLTSILLGIVSGIFPAIKIARIQPIQILSGKKEGLHSSGFAKKGLVVFQYTVSIVLIIATLILSQQFKYIKNRDLGFNANCLITASVGTEAEDKGSKLEIFRDEISSYSGVKNSAFSKMLPFYGHNSTGAHKIDAPKEDAVSVTYDVVEESFFECYDIKIIMNENHTINTQSAIKIDAVAMLEDMSKKYSEGYNDDVAYCSINETATKRFNFANPIGERIILWDLECEIVSVHQDYHISSVQHKIHPHVLVLGGDANSYDGYSWITLKCDINNLKEIKEKATRDLREYFPNNPYSFFYYSDNNFKEDTLNNILGVEKLLGAFTFIAIIIACMGIYGLIALSVKNKTKEIGIRKTLGSSVLAINKLIAREYLALAVLGNIIAWFPAWYFSDKILQDFAYRIEIGIGVFIIGFLASIILTLFTISFHTIKAARTNPVDALRYE